MTRPTSHMRHMVILASAAIWMGCGSIGAQPASSGSPVTFSNPTDYACPAVGNIVTGDIDGDGHPDIVVGGPEGGACILFNQGDGTFGAPVPLALPLGGTSTGIATQVAILDVNDDGKGDVFLGSESHVHLAFGRSDRTFEAPLDLNAGADARNFFALGDVDGDGTPDVCAQDSSQLGSNLTGISYLQPHGQPSQRSAFYKGDLALAFVADMNADKRGDLVGSSQGGVEVALTGKDGVPTSGTLYPVPDDGSGIGDGMFPADVNADGLVDVVAFLNRAHVAVLFGNVDGTLKSPVTSPTQAGSDDIQAAVLGDLDGDATPDAVVVTASQVILLHGNKEGTFAPWSSNLTPAMLAQDVSVSGALADFNGDGKLDFVEGDIHTARVFLRR